MDKPSISFLKLPRALKRWEKRLVIILLIVAALAVGTWLYLRYLETTEVVPEIGGTYIEGVLGQPKLINPIIAQPNTADADLVDLMYSPLFHFDQDNNIVPDLADSYEISDDAKQVTIKLKQNIQWQDGEPFNADDVVFTIESIQNPNLQSPLKSIFDNVIVEKVDDYTVALNLEEPYIPLVSSLTFGIIPKHLWEQVDPANIPLAELNMQPVGTGPYRFKEFKKDKLGEIISYTLERSDNYYANEPYIEEITFFFYPVKEDLVDALAVGEIDGLSYDSEIGEAVEFTEGLNRYVFRLPRYNAVFINYERNESLEFKKVREALQQSINWEEFQQVLPPDSTLIAAPILEDFVGYDQELIRAEFNFDAAHNLLHEAGWDEIDEEGFRKKDDQRLAFKLLVSDYPEHQAVANFLVEAWKKLGVEVEWESLSPADIQTRIRARDYDAVLFGQVTEHDPDPFPFWHSSQREDPGLNLTALKDKDIDALLEEGRQVTDETARADKYKAFQQKLLDDNVAIFLYSPRYHYAASENIQGIDTGVIITPAERFTNVSDWYIKTKRIPKEQ
ncbi:ABC transporter substrate-binding protein [Patescibacteria group bacterium]